MAFKPFFFLSNAFYTVQGENWHNFHDVCSCPELKLSPSKLFPGIFPLHSTKIMLCFGRSFVKGSCKHFKNYPELNKMSTVRLKSVSTVFELKRKLKLNVKASLLYDRNLNLLRSHITADKFVNSITATGLYDISCEEVVMSMCTGNVSKRIQWT